MRVAILIACALSLAAAAHAAPLDDADNAYDAGDYQTALQIVRPLAEKNDARAINRLAVMTEMGKGVDKDVPKSVDLYRKSAELGFADGQNNLGLMYLIGSGTAADPKEAKKWFAKAANQGHGFAHMNLGMMYGRGVGQPRDVVKAYMHLTMANAPQDLNDTSFLTMPNRMRDELTAGITPEQIKQAEAKAKACIKAKNRNCDKF